MRYALDVDYRDDGRGYVAAVGFAAWTDARPAAERVTVVDAVAPYEPGAFYKRELPCLLAALAAVRDAPTCVVVDGHVWLRDLDDPGLGARLWDALRRAVPVVGVAKQAFRGGVAEPVLRGSSAQPLWVTAAGMDAAEACARVREMHGEHRLPTLLRRADALCRGR
jgi:deoxyribonuclease V